MDTALEIHAHCRSVTSLEWARYHVSFFSKGALTHPLSQWLGTPRGQPEAGNQRTTPADADRASKLDPSLDKMAWPFGPPASFNAIVTAKRAHRAHAIDSAVAALQADGPLTTEEVAIVGKSGKPNHTPRERPVRLTRSRILAILGLEIVKSIRDREFTSTQVLKAFVKSAIIAHTETNCITEGKKVSCVRAV